MTDHDTLYLTGGYDNIKDAIINPAAWFGVNRFFIDHWLPRLGPDRAWQAVTLPRIALLKDQLAQGRRQQALAQLNADPLLRWFAPTLYLEFVHERGLYPALPAPPTPALLAGLRREVSARLTAGESLPDIVQSLTGEAKTDQPALLARLYTGPGEVTRPQTVTKVVLETFNLKAAGPGLIGWQGEDLQKLLAAINTLSNELLQPGKATQETSYFREEWLPLLGPAAAWLVVVLRGRFGRDAARPEFSMSKPELAAALGVSASALETILKSEQLARFFTKLNHAGPALTGRILMSDPLTPADAARAATLKPVAGCFESG